MSSCFQPVHIDHPVADDDENDNVKKPKMENNFLRQLTKRKHQEQEMKQLLSDILVYICYVMIVFIISYGNRDFNSFLQKEALQTAVIHGGLTCEIVPSDDPRY